MARNEHCAWPTSSGPSLLFDPMPFDAAAARAFAPIAAGLRASGKKRAARAHDTLTAAMAISRGLPLYTHNPDDFSAISGLDLRSV
ncbi:hypothetical protein [Nesterenkonia muleiensis]|uniref:hypothetical protein n=1 Tax=Nesterenkonia muleiensis TaxID=2282648 RepID=UPI001300B35D|nr:hypothetical protein [Nesterenkonia muleiensis]